MLVPGPVCPIRVPRVRPAEALRRTAFLLEATRADSHRSQAFRRAAATLSALPAGQLEVLWRQGRLQDLPHLGPTTAAMVGQALAGEPVPYLQALEEALPPPPSGPAGDLLAALRGDCHSHSDWSDGASPVDEMAATAAELGHDYLALTDHSPRLRVARGLSAERLERQLVLLEGLNSRTAPFRLLSGTEVDILEDGSLDQDPGLLARLDLVVASVHSKLAMPAAEMTRRLVAAVAGPDVDVLGHCTGRMVLGRGRPPSQFDAVEVFGACARYGTAVEVNCRPERLDPPDELLEVAVAMGCRLAVSSDAHAPGQLSWLANGCHKVVAAGGSPGSVVNTMGVDDLLAWTGRGA